MKHLFQTVRLTALLFSILAIPAWIVGVGIPVSLGYFAFYRLTHPALVAFSSGNITDKDFKRALVGALLGFVSAVLTVWLFHSMSALDSGEYEDAWLYFGYPAVGIVSMYLFVALLVVSKKKDSHL